MEFIITFFFIFLFIIFLYGYFSFYNKKKHLPSCNVIYILNEDMDDHNKPDFHEGRSKELYNLYNLLQK